MYQGEEKWKVAGDRETMRISFSIPLKPLSGKHKFAILLANEMRRQGVNVTDRKPDVNLVFLKGTRKGCKNIFRLDGVWMNTRVNVKKKNKNLVSAMNGCDGIVYQNNFCKKAGDKFLGKFKNHAVICNGSKLPERLPGFSHPRLYILTFCRWRPHKRLKATVRGFLRSGLSKDYDLIVAGKDPDYVIRNPTVVYKGHLGKNLWSLIHSSTFVVHLAYVDWCPNSVVESIVAGKNVLHSSTGGTKEVVEKNGIAVTDKPWKFKTIDLYSPPSLDSEEVARAYRDMLLLPKPNADYLSIENAANNYIQYCKEIINA